MLIKCLVKTEKKSCPCTNNEAYWSVEVQFHIF